MIVGAWLMAVMLWQQFEYYYYYYYNHHNIIVIMMKMINVSKHVQLINFKQHTSCDTVIVYDLSLFANM